MITTHIMGGLGNQLFQIFNLISYCLKYKIPFYFQNKKQERIDRPFYWDNFFKSLKPFVRDNNENMPIYKEQDFHYNELLSFNQINKQFAFVGYFQSYKYFNENYEQIIKFIRLRDQQESIKKKYIEYDFENIISLHFRIGDYKNLQQHHPLTKVEYYVKAIKYIIKVTERNNWKILYFYEEQDYEQVNENIKGIKLESELENINFIPINTKIVDYEQILLMSLCQHNIIANSSFSWWGAYFNKNSSKIICHPDPNNWFGPSQGNKKMDDLLPNTWINVYNKEKVPNFLIINSSLHHKNKIGIEKILSYLKWNYKYGTEQDIINFDIIFSPGLPIDVSKYPNKKFIFGPHFSVFPDHKMNLINNKYDNAVYIQPSKWATDVWKNMGADKILPIETLSFPVDINKFINLNKICNKVFIYFKRRQPEELEFIIKYLNKKNIEYKIFDYVKRYDETEYINYLQESKYGIILDAHESQGFAIQEALSCNVPLLVWNTKYMSQEYGSNYSDIPCSTIPYWDETCGDYFYDKEDFEKTFDIFIHKLDTYKPRQFILENLSVEKCAERFCMCNI
jgi:hypothetical protein